MKLKAVIFLLLSLAFFQPVEVKASVERRRAQLIEIIDEELKEVIRLNRQIGSKNPNLLLRMAELYLERARLINEDENMKWISLSPEETKGRDQKEFYKNSRKYFVMAQKTCYYILKRFKKFKGRADVYYILAYNAKEFQQEKKAKKFFVRAIKYAKRGSYTEIKSKLALGEMYYNEKKYKQAIPLYEVALKRKDQKWWTKDAYNLAWCYFRVGQKTKAIRLMSEVHKLSGNASFVDVSDQVERDLAYFYSEAGRT
ncbi:MAG: tetratricopeptide repeat protein, partial [Halobacteriovoraceae bacterium]|nr:tetratricopeptide repeat protein [Halobacteriovoraceae bacterium]